MSISKSIQTRIARFYRITIEGKIDPSWSDWMYGMEIYTRKEPDGIYVTTLCGTSIDQAGLRGLLNRLWDLNLVLRSIDEDDPTQKACKE